MEGYEKLTGFADEIAGDLETQLDALKKLKMHYVEMRGVDGKNLIHHDNAKVKEIKKRLEDAGVALSALGSPLGKIGIDDPFELHFEEFKRAVEIAQMMEAPRIRMFSFYVPREAPDWQQRKDAVKAKVLERLGRFVDYAKQENVTLLHENEKGIYGEKARECKELFDVLGCKNFRGIFDFANFVQAGQDTLEAYKLLRDQIDYVHVKDAVSGSGKVVPAGYGDGNVAEILGNMFDEGFRGFLSLEPHLSDFTGFAGLERGRKHIEMEEGKKLSGFEAFSLAREALFSILREKN